MTDEFGPTINGELWIAYNDQEDTDNDGPPCAIQVNTTGIDTFQILAKVGTGADDEPEAAVFVDRKNAWKLLDELERHLNWRTD